jgi:hypothetical protein
LKEAISTALGITVTFSGRNATGDDVSPQAFADGEDVVDLLDGPGFKFAGGAVAQAAFVGGAVVDRSIFPESTDFIDHRDAELAGTLMAGSAFRTGEWA